MHALFDSFYRVILMIRSSLAAGLIRLFRSRPILPLLGLLLVGLVILYKRQVPLDTARLGTAPGQDVTDGRARRLAAMAAQRLGYTLPYPDGPRRVVALEADVAPSPGKETVLGVTLGKHTGFVAVVAGRPPRVLAWVKDLSEVTRLEPFALPGDPHPGLRIEDHDDNLFGAYSRTTTVRLVRWQGEGPLAEVWSGVKDAVAYWNEAWDDPVRPALWLRATEEADIPPPRNGRFTVRRRKTVGRGEGPPGRIPRTFTAERSVEEEVTFRWDARAGRFVRHEGG